MKKGFPPGTQIRVRNAAEFKKLKSLLKGSGYNIYTHGAYPECIDLTASGCDVSTYTNEGKIMTPSVCERLAITKAAKVIKTVRGELYVMDGKLGDYDDDLKPVKNIDQFIAWSKKTRKETGATAEFKLAQCRSKRTLIEDELGPWWCVGHNDRRGYGGRLYAPKYTVTATEFMEIEKATRLVDVPDFIKDLGNAVGHAAYCHANGDIRFGCTRVSLKDMYKLKRALNTKTK